ncbi:MAG: murein biosynthesis integral membrane protein MurJ [Verrucomicrobiota bacterium]|jgi:putative peptidoglycan lipid II flippase
MSALESSPEESNSAVRPSGFARAASLVGLGIFSSRTVGLARDIITASLIGTTAAASAFSIAFTIPNLFRRLLGEGALAAGLVPFFAEELAKGNPRNAWSKAGKVLSVAALILLLLTLAGMLICWIGTGLTVPGTRLYMVFAYAFGLLAYMPMICLVGLSMGLLNACGHFFVPAFTPILLNASWILAGLLICPFLPKTPYHQAWGLVIGILAGGVIQLAVQIPILLKHGWRPRWEPHWRDPFVRNVFRLAAPAVIGLSVTQVNVVVDRTLAGYLSEYAASALFYAERLIYLPLGLVGTALGTVALPSMSRLFSKGDRIGMARIFERGLGLVLFWTLPAAVGLYWLGPEIVALIYEHGSFDQSSTAHVVWALRFYVPGLLAFSALKVIIPAFYAMKDTTTPVRVAWVALLLNLVLNLILMQWLEHGGLALATSVSAWVNGGVLLVLLRRRWSVPIFRPLVRPLARTSLASLVMLAAGMLALGAIKPLMEEQELSSLAVRLIKVGVGIGTAGTAYLAAQVALARFDRWRSE